MAAPTQRITSLTVRPRDLYELPEERTSRQGLSTDIAVMASIATAAVGIVQWPLLLAADRAVHLLERLRRHPDDTPVFRTGSDPQA